MIVRLMIVRVGGVVVLVVVVVIVVRMGLVPMSMSVFVMAMIVVRVMLVPVIVMRMMLVPVIRMIGVIAVLAMGMVVMCMVVPMRMPVMTLLRGAGGALQISQFLMQDIVRQFQRDFIQNRKRSHRHAGLDCDVFDHRGGDAFTEQRHPLIDEAAEDAAGVEAARVVDHDRRLAELQDEVVGACQRLIRCEPSADDFDQLHLVHR